MKILINEDGVTTIDPVNYPELDAKGIFSGSYIQIELGSQVGVGETGINTGTLVFEAKGPGAIDFVAISGTDTITVATPEPIVVGPNAFGALRCTAAGINGTGSLIELELTAIA